MSKTQPSANASETEELFVLEPVELPVLTGSLDDQESQELVLIDALATEHDQETDDELAPLPIDTSELLQSQHSFLDQDNESDAMELQVALREFAPAPTDDGIEFVAGLDDLQPLDGRDQNDDDGPINDELPSFVTEFPGFSLSPAPARAVTRLTDAQASAMFAARRDQFARHDDARSSNDSQAMVTTALRPALSAVSDGHLLAFCFSRGPGSLSLDGGDSFCAEAMLQGAVALAISEGCLFAAIYDRPFDRTCVVVRTLQGQWQRVFDLLDGADDGEQSLNEPTELVVVGAEGGAAKIVVLRTARACLAAHVSEL
jgi:hypothetical protein